MKCYLCGTIKNKDNTSVKHRICKTCNNKRASQYYLKNSQKLKERTQLWKKKNKKKVIEMSKQYRMELKLEALRSYSKNRIIKCVCCGEKEIDFLCLDHINNDGFKERKNRSIGASFSKWLKVKNYPKNLNLQVLCFNCNFSKRIHGVCIHKLKN